MFNTRLYRDSMIPHVSKSYRATKDGSEWTRHRQPFQKVLQDHVLGWASQPWGRVLILRAGGLRLMDGVAWKDSRTGGTPTPIEYTGLPLPFMASC